ncbi:MAG: GNAT family N-acetyltransferase [Trichormus sp. ATA11-4-KO1]|jgi:ribosomal protein S18 acetylase RimI-like enzyme|nr:GNAT family N-acetyltransferase [Trichormus sp. ATA11-4-KO1]
MVGELQWQHNVGTELRTKLERHYSIWAEMVKSIGMELNIRTATNEDVASCGLILHLAFTQVNTAHGFSSEFPSTEIGIQAAQFFINHFSYDTIVAEYNEQVVGLCFLDKRSVVHGVAIVAVHPHAQGKAIGRRLMETVLVHSKKACSIRLLQHTFNTQSIALYTSLGFDVKELIVLLSGKPKGEIPIGYSVRQMMHEDLERCKALSESALGFDRTKELQDALHMFKPVVAMRDERIVAYASATDAWQQNYGIAENEEAMKALILGISKLVPENLEFLLPIRQSSLFRWCLEKKFRVVKPMTLMSMGEYQEPKGSYFTSVAF